MIKIYPEENNLILEYRIEQGDLHWIVTKFREEQSYTIRRTFNFEIGDIFDKEMLDNVKNTSNNKNLDIAEANVFDLFGHDEIRFRLGILIGNYYHIKPGIIISKHSIFFSKEIKLEAKFFTSHRNISIFPKIERIVNSDIYIGGESEGALPEAVFRELIARFPSTHQKDLYESAMITSIIREYLDNIPDYLQKYDKYMNKKKKVVASKLLPALKEQELFKYRLILTKLENMLKNEGTFSEAQWQEEILAIITLLYPKYVQSFKNIAIHRKNQTKLFVDILVVDSGGYVDIIEIKKPFNSVIVSPTTYRDNHIPYRELTGTIMQIEKYIYYLNRWGPDGEAELTRRLNNPHDEFEVKLTNPGGLVIMGRDNNLTQAQRSDFEVVKRKYKNILDILTYDELIRRLRFTINLWGQQDGNTDIN
nr:Shedu immune nuclease family protein [uncultured Pedobacter sp.]